MQQPYECELFQNKLTTHFFSDQWDIIVGVGH